MYFYMAYVTLYFIIFVWFVRKVSSGVDPIPLLICLGLKDHTLVWETNEFSVSCLVLLSNRPDGLWYAIPVWFTSGIQWLMPICIYASDETGNSKMVGRRNTWTDFAIWWFWSDLKNWLVFFSFFFFACGWFNCSTWGLVTFRLAQTDSVFVRWMLLTKGTMILWLRVTRWAEKFQKTCIIIGFHFWVLTLFRFSEVAIACLGNFFFLCSRMLLAL